LAIDQTADERNDKPSVAKAVTLEVDTGSAQKLALAASIGTLSLMLRKAGEAAIDPTRRITLSDLVGETVMPQQEMTFATVKVHRPAKQEDYSVPAEKSTSVVTSDRRRSIQ
jgi:pilus assembly protein CpaB